MKPERGLEVLTKTKQTMTMPTGTEPVPVRPLAPLPKAMADLAVAEARERELIALEAQAESERSAAQAEWERVRVERAERLQAGATAQDVQALEAVETEAGLAFQTSETILSGRRRLVVEAGRETSRRREMLQSEERGANVLRLQIADLAERCRRMQHTLDAEEEQLAHRRELLRREEVLLDDLRRQLGAIVGECR